MRPARPGAAPAPPFEPARVLEVELGEPLPRLTRLDPGSGRRYSRARVLVRLHREPLGLLDVALPPGGLAQERLAPLVWQAFSPQINDHLRRDGLPALSALPTAGVPCPDTAGCARERREAWARAPLISVIVATRNGAGRLPPLLDRLLEQEYPDYELIVVDNAPSDDTTRRLVEARRAQDGRLRYVREDVPGLSNARNCGVRHARAGIVAITDDDVWPDPGWLLEIARGFEAGERVGCVTGAILARRLDTPAQLWTEQYGGFHKGFEARLFDLDRHRAPGRMYPYTAGMFGSGANLAFRKAALQAAGGFDPALGAGTAGLGGEELALFVRLLTGGVQIAYRPGALLYHTHHEEYGALRRQMYSYGAGLTAYLTKTVLDRPGHLGRMLLRLPHGLLYALHPGSGKNAGKGAAYPAELTRLELRGMLYGPLAYARSCWRVRSHAWARRGSV